MPEQEIKSIVGCSKQYAEACPYPHLEIEEFLPSAFADLVNDEFDLLLKKPSLWLTYKHFNEDKLTLEKSERFLDSINRVVSYLHSSHFISELEKLTNIKGLFPDKDMLGGGLSAVPNGGYLNFHTDFSHHPYRKNWKRRVNVILFFNKNWVEANGGSLELIEKKTKKAKKISPIHNKILIFETNRNTLHGFPEKIKLGLNKYRKSINLYFYSLEEDESKLYSTKYFPMNQDNVSKKVFIIIENYLLHIYSRLKRILFIDDKYVTKFFSLFSNRDQT